MRILSYLLLLTVLNSCNTTQKTENTFNPKIINRPLPLKLTEIDWQNPKAIFRENDQIEATIEQTIHEYYKENYLPDNLQADYYISTIHLQADFQIIFLILLRHPAGGYTNGKVLFYDNEKKEFIPGTFDFNLFALYDNADGKLKVSNLKEQFKIETPEIQLIDYNNDGLRDLQFTRLLHNGTYNAIKTTIVSIKNQKVDTLSTSEKLIGVLSESE